MVQRSADRVGKAQAGRRIGRLIAIALAMLMLCATAGRAQQFEAERLGQPQGLKNLAVTAMVQDTRGFLWVATGNGVFRYDGSQFREYGRSDGFDEPVAYSLTIDHTGTIWAGTHSGLYWFNGWRFVEVQWQGKSLRIGQNSTMSSTSGGELLANSPDELYSVERDGRGGWAAMPYRTRHPERPKLEDTNGLTVDQADALVIGCGEALCVEQGDRLERLGPAQGVPPDYYVALLTARDGRVWARGRKHIVVWTPGSGQVEDLTGLFPAGAERTVYRRMTEDGNGRILTPTADGFAMWDGSRWTETAQTNQGPVNGATDVFADREGSIWIGTEGDGLLHSLGYGQWANYGVQQGLNGPHVYAVEQDTRGVVWVGSNLGLNRIVPGAGAAQPSALAHEPDAQAVVSLAADAHGGMWAATLLGDVYHLNAAGAVDRRLHVDGYVARLRVGDDDRLWLAAGSALYTALCGDGQPCVLQPVPGPGGGGIRAKDVSLTRQGGVWVALDGSLIHLSRNGLEPMAVRAGAGVSMKGLRLLLVDPDGSFWLAGANPGLQHVRVEQGQAHLLATYHQPTLASDEVSFLGLDREHRVWVGTDDGVNVLTGRAQTESAKLLTEQDGLTWNDTGDRAFLAAPDGSVWIGTTAGVSHALHPDAILHRDPFRTVLETVNYGAARIEAGRDVPWDGRPTLVRFAALTFRDNASLLYHYRMDGAVHAAAVTQQNYAQFPYLEPGRYTVHVFAEDPHLHVVSSEATFSFRLAPTWWQSWQLKVLGAVAGCCLIVLIWRWSHLALLAQRNKLRRLVAERTQELQELAIHDSLTGLLNRRAILDALELEITHAKERRSSFCVALVDLDHFKQINDTYGHLAGDEVLRQSAARLASAVRATDLVGRYGGEEFFVIFRKTEEQIGMERCEAVRQALCSDPIVLETAGLTITCSIGLVCTDKGGDELTNIITRADEAMYTAKTKGRNRVVQSLGSRPPTVQTQDAVYGRQDHNMTDESP